MDPLLFEIRLHNVRVQTKKRPGSASRARTWTKGSKASCAAITPRRIGERNDSNGESSTVIMDSMNEDAPLNHISAPKRVRMTRAQRREQLIGIARELFGAKGYDAVSIEEIASAAEVSKPVVYEHFGGKEGLYQVIVDREITVLSDMLSSQMKPGLHPREMLEHIVLSSLITLKRTRTDSAFCRINHPPRSREGTFTTIIADVAEQVADLLAPVLNEQGLDPEDAPIYGQLLPAPSAVSASGGWRRACRPRRKRPPTLSTCCGWGCEAWSAT